MADNWVAGSLNSGLGWTTAFVSADLQSMATGSSVLSSTAAFANGTGLDKFMDISFSLTIASSTIVAGANIAFWIAYLNQDGSTYGDGSFTAGTPAARAPGWTPAASPFQLYAAASQTTLVGLVGGILIFPGSFALVAQNNSGFTLAASTQTVKIRTYNP